MINPNRTTSAQIAAILLTLLLFTLGSFPETGLAFPGVTHWLAHMAAYGLIAFAYARGWPRISRIGIFALVAGLGALHEVTEIVTHHHALEVADILVNALGAGLGCLAHRALCRRVER